ncbi:MAG TPA: diacylglycerol kinase family protein [Methyloceanibacter sp.]
MADAPTLDQNALTARTIAVRRVVALMNAGAGSFNQKLAAEIESELASAFAHRGVAATIKFVAGEDLQAEAEKALKQAKRGEIDAVVVGGGDGSIRTVAGVLAGTKVPLGVLPLGTLNHFAKDLGLPLHVEAAAGTIAAGHVRVIDLAEVNGETFINNSSIGIYPYMVIDRERRRAAHKLAKWAAMVPAFFRMLRHFPRRRLRIKAQGFAIPYRTPCLFVGNNEYGTELFTLGKRKHLDRGELWFYVVKPRNPAEFLLMVWRLCFGHIEQTRDLDTFRLSEAEIGARTSRLLVALDGEVRMLHTPLKYRSRPRALHVIVAEPAIV